jgi:septum formation protein
MNTPVAATLVLASASPRRSALLSQIGVAHQVRAEDVDETVLPGELPQQLVARLAGSKAAQGRQRLDGACAVLGADTVVVLGTQVFGKPRDAVDAARMLLQLGGRSHHVLTAVALALPGVDAPIVTALSDTQVWMRPIAPDEAARYWASGEPRDKAGSYAIQGLGAVFIEHIRGSYSGVMGLPLYETAQLLQAHGLTGGGG